MPRASAPPTWGLTHIALGVRDPARAARFYQRAVGARVVYRSADFVQLQTPGCRDVIVLERNDAKAGKIGGLAHFGFRLRRPKDIAAAARAVQHAGGTVTSQGEFCPASPTCSPATWTATSSRSGTRYPRPLDPGRAGRAKRGGR